jgi:ketosteroid isomerase-like protein
MEIDSPEARRLLDVLAIEELLRKYCRAVDRVDLELLTSCYHTDAVDTHPGTTIEDQHNFISWAEETLSKWGPGGMMHFLTNIVVEVDGDVAWAESYFHAFHWGMPRTDPNKNYLGGGRYIDRLERREGLWKIVERNPLREFHLVYPEGSFFTFEDDSYSASRDRSDPSYERTIPGS